MKERRIKKEETVGYFKVHNMIVNVLLFGTFCLLSGNRPPPPPESVKRSTAWGEPFRLTLPLQNGSEQEERNHHNQDDSNK